jgi:hypothetical protein
MTAQRSNGRHEMSTVVEDRLQKSFYRTVNEVKKSSLTYIHKNLQKAEVEHVSPGKLKFNPKNGRSKTRTAKV